jgi:hypothetical protein
MISAFQRCTELGCGGIRTIVNSGPMNQIRVFLDSA